MDWRKIVLITVIGIGVAIYFGMPPVSRMDAAQQKIRAKFPTVRQLATQDLSTWLADKSRPAPILVDVRTAQEYAVSHLPAARHVEPDSDPATALADVPKKSPIVVYCSIGYRSSACAEKLAAAGFSDVQNLSGSIFQWANEGRAIEKDGKPAATVHPYDKSWGELLKAPLRADVPPID